MNIKQSKTFTCIFTNAKKFRT